MAKENRAFDYSKYKDWIDPNKVKPYPNNSKLHPPEQVKQIANSIKRFGWQQDTVITEDNVLVVGHGRRLAAIEIGCKMPYHRVGKNADELTEDEIKALRLVDNKSAESGWDFGRLESEMKELEGFGMSDFGFVTEDSNFLTASDDEEEDDYPSDFETEEGTYSYTPTEGQETPRDDGYVPTKRVIIIYDPEQENVLRKMLGVTDEKLALMYSFDDIIGGAE